MWTDAFGSSFFSPRAIALEVNRLLNAMPLMVIASKQRFVYFIYFIRCLLC